MAKTISTWQRIRRTPYQAIGAVFMIFITLFVTAIFLLLAGMSSAVISYFETKPQLTVFLKDEKDKSSVDSLMEKLKSTGKVASLQYVSKDQALAIYREQNKNDPLLLEMVTADILPSSLEVSTTSPKYLAEMAEMIKKEPGIDEIVFQKEVVETLISWTSTVRKIGAVFIAFLLIASFFILFTTIGMKIALKKEEAEILKLVGATSWYIKKPFITEGISYGIIGGISAWFFVSSLFLYLGPFITSFLSGISKLVLYQSNYFTIYIWPPSLMVLALLFIILFFSGVMIGFISSLVAISRYMKH